MQLPKFQLTRSKSQKEASRAHDGVLDSVEFKHVKILRIISILVFTLFLLSLAYTGYFLYNRVQESLVGNEDLLLLPPPIQGDSINFKLYEEAVSIWEITHPTSTPSVQRNPFEAVQ